MLGRIALGPKVSAGPENDRIAMKMSQWSRTHGQFGTSVVLTSMAVLPFSAAMGPSLAVLPINT